MQAERECIPVVAVVAVVSDGILEAGIAELSEDEDELRIMDYMTIFSQQNDNATTIWLTRRSGFKRLGFEDDGGGDSVNGISSTGESGVATCE